MRTAILAGIAAAVIGAVPPALAQLERIGRDEAVAAVKTALQRGSTTAVATLGRVDGFLGDAWVKIPLPESATRAEQLLRRVGMGRYADELIVALNRAAESAVPEAKQIFLDSIRKMTLQDAKAIVAGGETAGTDYFRRTATPALHARFRPIVQRSTERVALAQRYEQFADKAAAVGLMRKEDADLDEYVTGKALDGLFLMVAEEEKKIRKDPVGTGSAILRKVFGAVL